MEQLTEKLLHFCKDFSSLIYIWSVGGYRTRYPLPPRERARVWVKPHLAETERARRESITAFPSYRSFTSEVIFSTESFASPNSIIVRSRKKSSF